MKEGLLIWGPETLVSKRLNGLNPSLLFAAFHTRAKVPFRPFMSIFQTIFPLKSQKWVCMFNVWKVARMNVNTFRFRKHSTFKSHAYENETNAQNDKFEFPWWSSTWIFIACLDFLENFHYWSLEYIIFPSIEGLSNWEILRSIKLTVEVFQLSHLRILFPTPPPYLSVCLLVRV